MCAQRVLIICDFPILAQSMVQAFSAGCDVTTRTWDASDPVHDLEADLVVLDVTMIGPRGARQILGQSAPGSRVAICSLHENEVQVYTIGDDGPTVEEEFSSLLSLGAAENGLRGHSRECRCFSPSRRLVVTETDGYKDPDPQ